MSESPQKLIPFAKIFEIAAIHIFNDPSLLEFIPDEKSVLVSPENMRKKSQEAAIQLSLLRFKHAEIKKALETEIDSEMRAGFEKRRDGCQAEIHARLQDWRSEAQLHEYKLQFEKQKRAAFVLERISGACEERKIALFLNSGSNPLPAGIISPASGARFLPNDSILECEIDGNTLSGIVYGDELAVREWLLEEDVIAGVYDTPEKRIRKCTELLDARLSNLLTCNCSKEEHFISIKAVIPGLLRKEFETVRRALGSRFPHTMRPGRRPNLPAEA